MRVGVFAGTDRPEAGGGHSLETEILRSLEELDDCGHSFVLFGRRRHGESPPGGRPHIEFRSTVVDFWTRARCRLVQALETLDRHLCRPWVWYAGKNYLDRVVAEAGIDLVWYLTPAFEPVDMAYIYTVWDLQHRLQPWFPEVSEGGQWKNRERRYARVLPRASAIITGTEQGKADIASLYRVPAERIHVIPFPTPRAPDISDDACASALAKFDLREGFLLYPAQFWPHKNHVGLLLALRCLGEEHGLKPDLVLTGSDKGNRLFIERKIRELGLEKRVRLLGFVSDADLAALYRSASALVLPTFFGPDNLPPLEAFALGCPVIASNVPGAREQLGEAAALFDPGDEKQMARAIASVLKEPFLRSSLIERGTQRAAAWTGRQYVRRVLEVIDALESYRRCWP